MNLNIAAGPLKKNKKKTQSPPNSLSKDLRLKISELILFMFLGISYVLWSKQINIHISVWVCAGLQRGKTARWQKEGEISIITVGKTDLFLWATKYCVETIELISTNTGFNLRRNTAHCYISKEISELNANSRSIWTVTGYQQRRPESWYIILMCFVQNQMIKQFFHGIFFF